MRRLLLPALMLALALTMLAPAAVAEIDLGVAVGINTESPVKGSNITVTVTVTDEGPLVGNETAYGNLTVWHNGTVLGTAELVFNGSEGTQLFQFHWVPTSKGHYALVANATVEGDVNLTNNEDSEAFEVGSPSGLELGEPTTVSAIVGILALVLFARFVGKPLVAALTSGPGAVIPMRAGDLEASLSGGAGAPEAALPPPNLAEQGGAIAERRGEDSVKTLRGWLDQ